MFYFTSDATSSVYLENLTIYNASMAENVFYVVYSVDLTLVNLKLEGNLSYDYETGVNSFLMILSDSTFTL